MDAGDFHTRLLETFRLEAAEHLDEMSSCLQAFSRCDNKSAPEILERVFREAHSLKGAARAVDLRHIERICQELESRFSELRSKQEIPDADGLTTFETAIDTISKLLDSNQPASNESDEIVELLKSVASKRQDDDASIARSESRDIYNQEAVQEPEPETGSISTESSPRSSESTRMAGARVSLEDLDRLFRRTEELFAACLGLKSIYSKCSSLRDIVNHQKAIAYRLRESRGSVQSGVNPSLNGASDFEELLSEHISAIEAIDDDCTKVMGDLGDTYRQLQSSVSELLDGVKQLQLLPIRTVLEHLPRMARGLGRDLGKQVTLSLVGEDIRIDKRVLDNLNEPLLHLIRNAVDHGIESEEEREKAGKEAVGMISITVSTVDAETIQIDVQDDGGGMDRDRLKERAIKHDIISDDDAELLEDDDILALIFHSGLSTSAIVTDISGRGLGLAIVQEKIEALEGTVRCRSEVSKGTVFSITLPVSLSTTRAVEVRLDDVSYLIPSNFVSSVVRVPLGKLGSVGGRTVLEHNGRPVTVARLREIFQLDRQGDADANSLLSLVVLHAGDQWAAVAVDSVVAERELIVKPLKSPLSNVPNVLGATMVADRQIILVLNASELVHNANRAEFIEHGFVDDADGTEAPRVLVVDDSVTSRQLLRDIMKGSGYRVETAEDGADALMKLRESEFDLVISDVDMPRLNGFDLVRKIRAETSQSQIPVILVTSLDSREDKERGIEVGANAYIVKTSFDQSNLLEIASQFV